tara:strand:+ start:946 stop:1134 length:189 start_codon:yes stop_codon:yes gene_type:complete
MCSYYQGACLTPFTFPTNYNSMYDCLLDGYQKSYDKIEEIGRKEINAHGIYLKFDCKPATNT